MSRSKGRHGDKWFIDLVGKLVLNEKTGTTIYIESVKHAKQLRLIQDLNNMKYVKI